MIDTEQTPWLMTLALVANLKVEVEENQVQFGVGRR